MKKIAFIFPGQGSQYIGMGKDFFYNFEVSKKVFLEADEILGYKLSDIIFNGPKEKLTLTQNCQLAVFVNSMAILKAIEESYQNLQPSICAGLSLGEYAALVASEKLSFKDALLLIQKRAKYMDEACEKTSGTMSAVLKLSDEDVLNTINNIDDVWAANFNTQGQIVISGKKKAVEEASIQLKEKGAKVIPLVVQGAFHSPLMQEAEDKIKNDIANIDVKSTDIDIIMNAIADIEKDVNKIKQLMTNQITSSVQWKSSIEKMIENGIELFIEIGCGKTLTNMNKKNAKDKKTISVEKVSDLKLLDGENYA